MTTATPEPGPGPADIGAPRHSRARWLAPLGAALAVAVVLGGVVLLRHDSADPAGAAPPLYLDGPMGLAAAADRVAPVAPATAGGYEVTGTLPDGPAKAAVRTFGSGPLPADRFDTLVAALGMSGRPKQVGGSWVLTTPKATITAGPNGGHPWIWLPPGVPGCAVPDTAGNTTAVCAVPAPAPIPYPAPDAPVGRDCGADPAAGACAPPASAPPAPAPPASAPVGGPAVDVPATDDAGTSKPGAGAAAGPANGPGGAPAGPAGNTASGGRPAGNAGTDAGSAGNPASGGGSAASPGSAGSAGNPAGNAGPSTGSGSSSTSQGGPRPLPRPTGPTPSEMSIRAAGTKILPTLGLGDAAITINTYPGGARLTADPVVDGLPTVGMQTWLAFDGTATLVGGGGFLVTPTAGPEYPLISAKAALATLPVLAVGVAECNDKQCDGAAPPAKTPITGARLGLALRFDYHQHAQILVPAWLFTIVKSTYVIPVVAVDPAYLGTPPTPGGGPGIGTAAPTNIVPPVPPATALPPSPKPAQPAPGGAIPVKPTR
jgi:hypothetical protein